MIVKDEIVEEVRTMRESYAARFNYDLKEMYRDLKAKELICPGKIAPLLPVQPKPESPTAG